MKALDYCAVGYPQIVHPLMKEKELLKKKYIYLLKYYADKFCDGDRVSSYKITTLTNVLFKENNSLNEFMHIKYEDAVHSVMKTRFASFRFFSYCFSFMFDVIFITAADDKELGNKIFNEFKLTVKKRYREELKKIKDKMYAGEVDFSYKNLITDEMMTAWENMYEFCQSKNRNITFTATMSAGKSTLINAIIGKDLSYSKKAACTSSVINFYSTPFKNDLMNVLCNDNIFVMQTEQDVKKFTQNLETECSIRSYFFSTLTLKKITLIDTPGVNSSQNTNHKKITCNELTSCSTDILVYVIPALYYGSEDDFSHLNYIRKNVKYKKILFSVNMVDSCSPDDDSIIEIIEDIKKHLENIGFESPIICPMSAKAGMLIKRALCGLDLSESGKEACETYVKIFQREGLALSEFYPKADKRDINISPLWLPADIDVVWNAYINTGLPGFEALLYKITEER